MAKPTGHTEPRPDCILCGVEMFGKPFETTEGLMCGDGQGCRRRAYHKFAKQQLKLRPGDQPLPIINEEVSIQDRVIADIQARKEVGISRYGTALQPFNGRDALQDLYDELIDATQYVKQVIVERDADDSVSAK